MSETTKKKSVRTRLQECRVELQKKNIKKSGKNKFADFEYYELGDFLPIVNEMFLEKGLFAEFSILENTTAVLVISDIDNFDDKVVFESPIADANIKGCTPVQSLGGVHTYLKRYLYINALEIVESDMFDGKVGSADFGNESPAQPSQKPKTNTPEKTATDGQIKAILKMFDNTTINEMLSSYNRKGIEELTMKEASDIIGGKTIFEPKF